jgi:hypothetical protein
MSWDNRNLRCHNCTMWWPAAEAAGKEPSRERSLLGQCRRHAPPALVSDQLEHVRHYPGWVTTKRDDWCGEHQHKEM